MNLVEAPDHAGPVAPPHAPERLRTLLAEGRDAQNDETAQSERAGFSPLKLNLDSYSESKDSNIFALGWSLWRGGSPSLVVFYSPLTVLILYVPGYSTSDTSTRLNQGPKSKTLADAPISSCLLRLLMRHLGLPCPSPPSLEQLLPSSPQTCCSHSP